jgi:hypothetical protein
MVMRWLCLLLAAALLAGGCARDVHMRMVNAPEQQADTGSLEIVLTQPARDLVVAVNGVLVTRRAHTREVRLDGIPAGFADFAIAAGSGPERVDLRSRVVIHPGRTTAIPLAAPETSPATAVYRGALGVFGWLIGRGITTLLF